MAAPELLTLALAALAPELQEAGGTLAGADLGGREPLDLSRYLLVCVGAILFVGLLGWAVRRFFGQALRRRAQLRSLEVMDMLPLGGKQRLAVVRCYDRTFLLGLGDKEVSLVSELDAVLQPEPPPRSSVESKSFADLVRRRLRGDAGAARVPAATGEPAAERQHELEPVARPRLGPEGLLG